LEDKEQLINTFISDLMQVGEDGSLSPFRRAAVLLIVAQIGHFQVHKTLPKAQLCVRLLDISRHMVHSNQELATINFMKVQALNAEREIREKINEHKSAAIEVLRARAGTLSDYTTTEEVTVKTGFWRKLWGKMKEGFGRKKKGGKGKGEIKVQLHPISSERTNAHLYSYQ
jgi:hypothetical protein